MKRLPAIFFCPLLVATLVCGALVLDAVAESIPEVVIPKTARTSRDFAHDQRAWCERVMVAPFLKRAAGQPWEKDAASFVNDALNAWGDEDDTHDAVVARGEELMKVCKDPLVRFLAAKATYQASYDWRFIKTGFADMGSFWHSNTEQAGREYREARHGFDKLKTFAGVSRFIAVEEAIANMDANDRGRADSLIKKIVDLTRLSLKDGSYSKDEAALFISHIYRFPWIRTSNLQLAQLGAEFEAAEFPDWAKVALSGLHLKGRAAIEKLLPRDERDKLEIEGHNLMAKSLRLNPNQPELANAIMSASFVGMGPTDEKAERNWFKVALAAEADFDRAYHSVREVLRSYRGGSPEEILEFGRSALATKRFDTGAPAQFLQSLERLPNEGVSDWRAKFSTEQMSKDIAALAKGLTEESSRKGKEDLWRGRCAIYAFVFGDPKLAADLIRKLPDGRLPLAARHDLKMFGFTPEELSGEIAMADSPALAYFRRADALLEKGDFLGAKTENGKAAAAVPKNAAAKKLVARQGLIIEFETKYQAGDWVSVPTEPTVWDIFEGSWSGVGDGLVAEGTNDRTAAFFRGRISSEYELRGEYEIALAAEFKGHPEVGIIARNCRSFGPQYWMGFSVWESDKSTKWGTGIRDRFYVPSVARSLPEVPPEAKVDFQLKNTFHLVASKSLLSWTLNGHTLFTDVPVTLYNSTKAGARFGVGSPNFQKGQTTTFRALQVRKRAEEK